VVPSSRARPTMPRLRPAGRQRCLPQPRCIPPQALSEQPPSPPAAFGQPPLLRRNERREARGLRTVDLCRCRAARFRAVADRLAVFFLPSSFLRSVTEPLASSVGLVVRVSSVCPWGRRSVSVRHRRAAAAAPRASARSSVCHTVPVPFCICGLSVQPVLRTSPSSSPISHVTRSPAPGTRSPYRSPSCSFRLVPSSEPCPSPAWLARVHRGDCGWAGGYPPGSPGGFFVWGCFLAVGCGDPVLPWEFEWVFCAICGCGCFCDHLFVIGLCLAIRCGWSFVCCAPF